MEHALDLMRGLGVRYIVIHPDDFVPGELGPETLDRLRAARGKWIDTRQFGSAHAFVLPAAAGAPRAREGDATPLPAAAIHVNTSHRSDLARWLVDGRRDTIWTSGVPQSGTEWIELEFEHDVDVRRLRLEMDSTILSDYPRALAVDAIAANGANSTRLFEGSPMIEFGRSFTLNPMRPAIDLALLSHRTRRIRIAQTGAANWWWSVSDITVVGR
jgi:hypothetical protein